MESKQNMQAAEQQQACPRCQKTVPVFSGYVTWCECGWNLLPQKPVLDRGKFGNLFDSIYDKAGKKFSRSLYEQVVKEQVKQTKGKAANLLALLTASLVHVLTLVVLALGVDIIVSAWPEVHGFFWGGLCMAIAFMLRPHFGKMPKKVLSRTEYPALYQLVDDISDAVGTSRVEAILVTSDFNAWFAQVGLRRKKVLAIGLPLFAVLNNQEKVALLGHEVAHGANGDPNRGLFLHSAIRSLVDWYLLLNPGQGQRRRGGGVSAFVVGLLRGVSKLIYFWLFVLVHLTYRESQRAEYYADAVATETSGTAAMQGLLDKLHLSDTFYFSMQKAFTNKGQEFFQTFQEQVQAVPEREMERIRQIGLLEDSRLDTTHPPTAYRIGFMKEHHAQVPRYELSAALADRIEKELLPQKKRVEEELMGWFRRRLYM